MPVPWSRPAPMPAPALNKSQETRLLFTAHRLHWTFHRQEILIIYKYSKLPASGAARGDLGKLLSFHAHQRARAGTGDAARTLTAWGALLGRARKSPGAALVFGVLCSGIAYILYFKLTDDDGPTSALTVTFLNPLFGILWGVIFLNEIVGWYTAAGDRLRATF